MRALTLVFLLALAVVVTAKHHKDKHGKGHKKDKCKGPNKYGPGCSRVTWAATGAGVAAGASYSQYNPTWKPIQRRPILHGVNRAGTEFACIKGDGIFTEGPIDDASIKAMKAWNINAVRIPLNADCWLGKNVPRPEHGGYYYQTAIKEYVMRLRQHSLYVILDLHWTQGKYEGKGQGACTTVAAKCQKPMPDKENTPQFWKEVATMFKYDPDGIIFDLFNEPFPDMKLENKAEAWLCWQKGGAACKNLFEFEVAGMEDLINAVRYTGATNLLMLGGLTWANDLDGWLDYIPKNDKNLAASMHSYDLNACVDEACWDKGIGKIVKAGYQVIVGELAEHGCKHVYIDKFMPYLDKYNINYIAWTWNTWDCSSGPALIKDYYGTPTDFGIGYKNHLASLPW